MAMETTYTTLRQNLASILDHVVDSRETVLVRRRGARDVALIPAEELAGIVETAHLLRSPRNAQRLLVALHRAERRKTKLSNVKKKQLPAGRGSLTGGCLQAVSDHLSANTAGC